MEPYAVAKSAPSEGVKWSEQPLITSEPWVQDALCAQTDPEIFFPAKGGSTAAAKAICEGCGALARCAEYSLRTGQGDGIWGSLSPKQRARIHKKGEYPLWKRLAEREAERAARGEEAPIVTSRPARDDIDERIVTLHSQGLSDPRIAVVIKMSTATIHRRRLRMGLPDVPRQRRQS